ncbi:universal stress protein [Virgibacillus sp. MG-45]|uniref:universal stress protein n=1 Tax=Virgibacillus sp. MG-45 TaxID=3102791 RepID=UPI002EDB414E
MKRILVAYDGSNLSKRALEEARLQATENPQVEIHLISVVTHAGPSTNKAIASSIMMELAEEIRPILSRIEKELKEEGIKVISEVMVDYSQGNPGVKVCEYAENHHMDLIIVGSRGLGNMKSFFLGSVSNNVVQHAKCPVLIMK